MGLAVESPRISDLNNARAHWCERSCGRNNQVWKVLKDLVIHLNSLINAIINLEDLVES